VKVTGVEVLLEQAFDQSRLWLGLLPPKEFIVSELEKADARKEADMKNAGKL
jgi:shikimate 5-dehydrogenase